MTFNQGSHDEIERSTAEIDLTSYAEARAAVTSPLNPTRQKYVPSPAEWQDQVLYFLMLDRFSDGTEKGRVTTAGGVRDLYRDNDGNALAGGTTDPFDFAADAYKADIDSWFAGGGTFCGGTLAGLRAKLGYLKRMGITAVWVSPVFKQVDKTLDPRRGQLVSTDSYHGYGIQNFLDVDPRFGTRQDLRDVVDEAHRLGIYVILDIIFNHAGDVFQYAADRYGFNQQGESLGTDPFGTRVMDARWDNGPYRVLGYRNAFGAAVLPFGAVDQTRFPSAWPNDAIWPAELQPAATFTQKGRISNFDNDPEFLEGDFSSLKDVDHGFHPRKPNGEKDLGDFFPSRALSTLVDCFKFWIAFADIDGFRIDTVKHMEKGATRYFVSAIREFAVSLGKEDFLLLGEITGGRVRAFETLEETGLSAALGIDEVSERMEFLAKGFRNPTDYFNLFRNSEVVGQSSHTWFGRHVVTMFDDHDRVGRAKTRFSGDKVNEGYLYLVPAIALNLASMGIPCLYYGTEQGFDGGEQQVPDDKKNDRLLRECMFGGRFGSLRSRARHFFDEGHPAYKVIRDVCSERAKRLALRRGRQYLREISETNPGDFGLPRFLDGGRLRSIVPWSRIFSNHEVLCAINTDADNARTVWVTIDSSLHRTGDTLTLQYAAEGGAQPRTVTGSGAVPGSLRVEDGNGKAVKVTVPPAGFVIYE